jgi:hypothetical protein
LLLHDFHHNHSPYQYNQFMCNLCAIYVLFRFNDLCHLGWLWRLRAACLSAFQERQCVTSAPLPIHAHIYNAGARTTPGDRECYYYF